MVNAISFPSESAFIGALYDQVSKSPERLFDFLRNALGCKSITVTSSEPRLSDSVHLLHDFRQPGANKDAFSAIGSSVFDWNIHSDKTPQVNFQLDTKDQTMAFAIEGEANPNWLMLEFPEPITNSSLVRTNFIAKVVPHILRAVRLVRRIAQHKYASELKVQAVDQLSIPAFAVDRRYQIIHRNYFARSIASARDSSQVHCGPDLDGIFATENLGKNMELRHQIDVAFERPSSSKIQYVNADTTAVPIVFLSPPNNNLALNFGRELEAFVWMFVLAMDQSGLLLNNPKFTDFGLSKTEEQLVILLFEGLALKEVARERNVSWDTVRKQLRSVFRKTGVDSQESLMLMLFTRCIYPAMMQFSSVGDSK